jgi:hypothetical protein
VDEVLEGSGIPFLDERSGHPDMGKYVDDGYEVITL